MSPLPLFSKLSPKQAGILLGGVGVIVVLYVLFSFGGRGGKSAAIPGAPATLTVWGIEDKNSFSGILGAYAALRPSIKISYRQIDPATYEETLLNALAAGYGPDVFMLGNHWLGKELRKITPVDPNQFSLLRLQQLFPDVVRQDFMTADGKLYALPLSLDTLALFYNKDMFNAAGIVNPPATWEQFQSLVPSLKILNANGQIERAATAMGGTEKSVAYGVDLLHLLMLQNGVAMTDTNNITATFAKAEAGRGAQAFNFYLQFANPASAYYTWNDAQPDSVDSFAAGATAMIFAPHRALAEIKNKSPFLNIDIAPVPQTNLPTDSVGKVVTYPAYWGLAVSRQSKTPAWAWDFVISAATNPNGLRGYLNAIHTPPALKSMLPEKLNDPEFTVFARQALTAASWYQADNDKIKDIFNTAIANVLNGHLDATRALQQAQDQTSQLMRPTTN